MCCGVYEYVHMEEECKESVSRHKMSDGLIILVAVQ